MTDMQCPVCHRSDDLDYFTYLVRWTQTKAFPLSIDRDGTISAVYRHEETYPDSDLVGTVRHDRSDCGREFPADDWNVEY